MISTTDVQRSVYTVGLDTGHVRNPNQRYKPIADQYDVPPYVILWALFAIPRDMDIVKLVK
jgi:hypothetical protein